MAKVSADWLSSKATQQVFSLLSDAGFAVFAVGGFVRNTLLGAPVHDIDLSPTRAPRW